MVDVCTQRLYVKTPNNNCKISCNTVVGLKDGCPFLGVITISIPMSLFAQGKTLIKFNHNNEREEYIFIECINERIKIIYREGYDNPTQG